MPWNLAGFPPCAAWLHGGANLGIAGKRRLAADYRDGKASRADSVPRDYPGERQPQAVILGTILMPFNAHSHNGIRVGMGKWGN
jgi:hypothetical protein